MTQQKWPWFERVFAFDFPAEKMPEILERLTGTPLRMRALLEGMPESVLEKRESDSTWSTKENVGHLADVESLWIGRIDDITGGQPMMRAADLTNRATFDADHNERSKMQLIDLISRSRQSLLDHIKKLSFEQWSSSALHPRLKTPMRVVDLCHFVAEHDDYHLARARYLIGRFSVG